MPRRTLEIIAGELAQRDHWPDRPGTEFLLCVPCSERAGNLAGVPYPCPQSVLDIEVYLKALHEAQDIGRT